MYIKFKMFMYGSDDEWKLLIIGNFLSPTQSKIIRTEPNSNLSHDIIIQVKHLHTNFQLNMSKYGDIERKV